jgi:putative acetyltransferase
LRLSVVSPRHEGVPELLAASDAYMADLYPSESNHMTDIQSLENPRVTMVAVLVDEIAVACGALVRGTDGYAELKRMFMSPELRGRGLGKEILRNLIAVADAQGFALRLETGIKQPGAIGLYRSHGFEEVDAFEPYSPDPLSIFMERKFEATAALPITR